MPMIPLERTVTTTVDGERMDVAKARALSRRFALLPWMWIMNVWLFWPDFRHGHDPVVHKYTQRSLVGFVVVSLVFLPWMIIYMIGQEAVVGKKLFNKLDVAQLDLSDYGLAF